MSNFGESLRALGGHVVTLGLITAVGLLGCADSAYASVHYDAEPVQTASRPDNGGNTLPADFDPLAVIESHADQSARMLTHYSIAVLAAADSDHALAADHFARAHAASGGSSYLAERAFVGLVYSGEINKAMQIARQMAELKTVDDELVKLMHILDAYEREDWAEVQKRGNVKDRAKGFGYIVAPILVAFSHSAEGDLDAAEAALEPLTASPSLKSIGDEFFSYMVEHAASAAVAEKKYKEMVALDQPPSLQPVVAYADFLVRSGREKDARELFSDQLERFAGNNFLQREAYRTLYLGGPSHRVSTPRGAASMLFYRMGSELSQGDSSGDAAIIYLELARYFAPQVADIHILLGTVLDRLGRPRAAAEAYGRVGVNDPSYASARLRRVNALRQSGQNGEAEALITSALADKPDDQQLLSTLAELHRAEGRLDEAEAGYDRILKMIKAPTEAHWWLYFSRGVVREQLNRWPDAEKDLLIALRLNPDQPELLNYLGYSWVDRGERMADAQRLIEKAVDQRPEDGAVIDSLGWVYYLTGNYKKAVELLERAVHLEPADSVINAHLGDAYWQAGRHREARFQWRHALTLEPESDADRRALEDKLDLGIVELAQDLTAGQSQ